MGIRFRFDARSGHSCHPTSVTTVVRRKFVDVFSSQGSVFAEEAIRRIAELYLSHREKIIGMSEKMLLRLQKPLKSKEKGRLHGRPEANLEPATHRRSETASNRSLVGGAAFFHL